MRVHFGPVAFFILGLFARDDPANEKLPIALKLILRVLWDRQSNVPSEGHEGNR